MRAIAINIGTAQSPKWIGAIRILDENGIGTDEILHLETPPRLWRRQAYADARAAIEQGRPDSEGV